MFIEHNKWLRRSEIFGARTLREILVIDSCPPERQHYRSPVEYRQ